MPCQCGGPTDNDLHQARGERSPTFSRSKGWSAASAATGTPPMRGRGRQNIPAL